MKPAKNQKDQRFRPRNSRTATSEYPRAAVGTTKGRSAKVSRMLVHRDLLRVINQAKGTPAKRSNAATIRPITNEFPIATSAALVSSG